MSKHTSGPWKLIDDDMDYIAITDEEQETGVCELREEAHHDRETMKANARLIAAAPDLLVVAKLVLAEWEKEMAGVLKGELIARLSNYSELARNAVKKAEGDGR